MATMVKISGVGLILLIMVAAVCLMVMPRNSTHAVERHGVDEVSLIRSTYNGGVCEGKELWFSPTRGTILILCGIPNSAKWGGLIYRVTENEGQTILPEGEMYECTVFLAEREYWGSVISRDTYLPLLNFPDIERAARSFLH